jgi:DNA-binding SARP family transcriptional activator
MKAPLQIKVLGELAVVRDAQEIVLPASKKTRALLAYLALANRRQRQRCRGIR